MAFHNGGRALRFLFCWELGSGSGHLTGLIRVAEALVENGHEIIFVIPEPDALGKLQSAWKARSNVTVQAAPTWPLTNAQHAQSERTYSFADVLGKMGFTDPDIVSRNVSSWDRLIQQLNPDAIIAEFAPGCVTAARGRIPCIVFGNGYYVLPSVSQLPSMTAWDPGLPPSSIQREMCIADLINRTRQSLGLGRLPSLSHAFRGDDTFVCTFKSLDPYGAIRNEPTYCPFNIAYPSRRSSRPLQEKVFVYFSFPHPAIQHFLQLILSQRNIPCIVYAPPYAEQLLPMQGVNGHHFLDHPMDLHRLSEFGICVHHGGMGISSTAAIAGVPQIIVPVNLEHAITAQSLCQQNGALMCLPEMVMQWSNPEPLIRGITCARQLSMQLNDEFHVSAESSRKTLETIQLLCTQVGK